MNSSDINYWMTVGPEKLSKGDTVRVLADAFKGLSGQMHNGRVGVIVDKGDGNIIVATTDGKSPVLTKTRYPFYKLEKAFQ